MGAILSVILAPGCRGWYSRRRLAPPGVKRVKRLFWLLLLNVMVVTAAPAAKHRVLFNRFHVPEIGIFIADAAGANERPITPHQESEYSPSLSADAKWVVYTSERAGQADI